MTTKIEHSFSKPLEKAIDNLTEEHEEDLQQILDIGGISPRQLDVAAFTDQFLNEDSSVANYSVDPNANVSEHTVEQFSTELPKSYLRLNALNILGSRLEENYGIEKATSILEKVIDGELFINDLDKFLKPYCYAFTLNNLLNEGIPFATDEYDVKPPKRSQSFINLVIQMVSYIGDHIAGASSFPSFFVDLDWFLRNELGDDYVTNSEKWEENKYQIQNQFQNLIYSLNWKFRSGQSPFSNFSVFDRIFLETLFSDYIYPDGSTPCFDSAYELQKRFAEYFTDIFGDEGIFTFPIITLAITVDDDHDIQDQDFLKWACEINSDKGLFNLYCGPNSSLSSCCRLRNGLKSMSSKDQGGGSLGYTNSFGSASLNIGSHRVAGLNFPRIALRANNEGKDPKEIVKENVNDLHKILLCHRNLIEDEIDKGLMPLYDNGWISLSRQYSTVGFIGAYEFLDIIDKDMHNNEDREYFLEILQTINEMNDKQEEKTGNPHNIEQIPGESLAVRAADKDDIIYNAGYNLYSNQYFPLVDDVAMIDRIETAGYFDEHTAGGAILHINVTDQDSVSPEIMKRLITAAVHKGCMYFSVNHDFVRCENDHVNIGSSEETECPECGADITEQYTRVVGFITPRSSWVEERRENEYEERRRYESAI